MAVPSIIVPALTLWNLSGEVDRGATAAYAQRAADTWLDLFMLSGSIGEGKTSTPFARRCTLEAWLDKVPKERLLTCIWSDDDYDAALSLGVRPVVVLQNLENSKSLMKLLSRIPTGSFIYSHPQYSQTTLTPSNAARAVQEGVLPAGGKLSKISLEDLRNLRTTVGNEFALYDGRCRHIEASVRAGANGVVVVPFSALPLQLPHRHEITKLQSLINQMQSLVDNQKGTNAQARLLTEILSANL